MGKGWKQAGILQKSQKKGMEFTKLAREIQVAARLGGGDPEANSRLKSAIKEAVEASCPKATIERAIQRGLGVLGKQEEIEEVLYEGQAPHHVGVLVACQTNNKNRTVTDLRSIFHKHKGQMVEKGGALWMFEKVCLVVGEKQDAADPEEDAIEAGAMEVEKKGSHIYCFYGEPQDLDCIRKKLLERKWSVLKAKLFYKPKNPMKLTEEKRQDVLSLLEALEDNEDSHEVFSTLD